MNTLKKIVSLTLMAALLVCVAFAFASCNLGGLGGNANGGEVTHCPDDCECRADDTPDESEHCPADCDCRLDGTTTTVKTTYLVVIRDDQGNIVPGVSLKITDGESFVEKVTDENGFLTFPLVQGTWNVQVTAVPDGYKFDASVKHEFNAEGVCAITLEKPVGYVFNVKSFYDDAAIKNAFVTLYSYNEETMEYDVKVAEAVSDADGKVIVEAVAGEYMAEIYVEGYAPYEVYIPAPSKTDVIDASLFFVDGTDALAPIYPGYDFDGTFDIEIEAGKTVYYAFRNVVESTLVINSESAIVVVDGKTYAAEEGVIEIKIDAKDAFADPTVIAFTTDLEEGTDAYEAVLTFKEGSNENPKVIESLDELANVSVEKGTEGNETYYNWVADFTGTLILTSDSEYANVVVRIDEKSVYEVIDADASAVSIEVTAGDIVTIAVGTLLIDAEGAYTYPEADVSIANYAYIDYSVLLANFYNVPFANVPVSFVYTYYDEELEEFAADIMAIVNTNALGYAKVSLPKLASEDDYYNVVVVYEDYAVPEGAMVSNSDNEISLIMSNGTEESPYLLDGSNGSIPLVAGQTAYYVFKTAKDTDVTIMGGDLNDDFMLGDDEKTFEVVYNGVTYSPVVNAIRGIWAITFSVEVAEENTAEYFMFTVTNKTAYDAINDEETYSYHALEVSLAKEGSSEKPFTLDTLGEFEADVEESEVYYVWTADATGILVIESAFANNMMNLYNLTSYQTTSYLPGASSFFLPVTEGDEIQISVGTADGEAAVVPFKLSILNIEDVTAENPLVVDGSNGLDLSLIAGTYYFKLTGVNGFLMNLDSSEYYTAYFVGSDEAIAFGTMVALPAEGDIIIKVVATDTCAFYGSINKEYRVGDVIEGVAEGWSGAEEALYVSEAVKITVTTTCETANIVIMDEQWNMVSSYDYMTGTYALTISLEVAGDQIVSVAVRDNMGASADYTITIEAIAE